MLFYVDALAWDILTLHIEKMDLKGVLDLVYTAIVAMGERVKEAILSKSGLFCYSGGLVGMDLVFTLLLSGDVELNPRATNQQKNNKSTKTDETQDSSEILMRLEKKIECSQECILDNQNKMLALLLSTIEEDIERFKVILRI